MTTKNGDKNIAFDDFLTERFFLTDCKYLLIRKLYLKLLRTKNTSM